MPPTTGRPGCSSFRYSRNGETGKVTSARIVTRATSSTSGKPATAAPSSVARATAWYGSISAPGSDAAQTAAPGPSWSSVCPATTPEPTQPTRQPGRSTSRTAAAAASGSARWCELRKRNAASGSPPPSPPSASRAASAAASAEPRALDRPAAILVVAVIGSTSSVYDGHVDTFLAVASKRDERRYDARPLPAETVRRILDAGRLAGSARNRQPWRFHVLEGDRKDEVAETVYAPDNVRGAPLAVAITISGKGPTSFDAGRATQNML